MFQKGNTKGKKLNYTMVRDIRSKYQRGVTQGALAREYGMDCSHIGRIVRRECWNNVPDEPKLLSQAELDASVARINALLEAGAPTSEK